jgi:hypothetical protein
MNEVKEYVARDALGHPYATQGFVPDENKFSPWIMRSLGTAVITVEDDASNSDAQQGHMLDLICFKMPLDPVGTSFKLQRRNSPDEDFEDIITLGSGSTVTFGVTAGNKGKWVTPDIFAESVRGLTEFRFVSNGTETANQSIPYVLR